MKDNYPNINEAAQVSRTMAQEFMKPEDERGLADKAWNNSLKRLKAVFKHLQVEYSLPKNPFDGIKNRTEEQVRQAQFVASRLRIHPPPGSVNSFLASSQPFTEASAPFFAKEEPPGVAIAKGLPTRSVESGQVSG